MAKRNIDIVIQGRYDGRHAFQEAKNDVQAYLASIRERGQKLSPLGEMVAGGERLDARRAAEKAAQEQQLREQIRMRDELSSVYASTRSQWLAEEQAAIKADVAAQWTASQQKVSIALSEYRSRVAIEDRLFASTHSRREVELNELQTYYARLRTQHAGNAKMLALIDKTYTAEAQQIQSGGGLMGYGGRGGNTRALRANARFIAAGAGGQIGGAVGMTMSNLLAFGATGGVLAGAFLAAGTSVRKLNESLEETKRISAEAARSGVALAEAMNPPAPTTARGDRLKGQSDQQLTDIEKVKEGQAKYNTWYARWVYADFIEKRAFYDDELEVKERQHRLTEKQREKEREIFLIRRDAADAAAIESARLQGLVDGPLKRRLELERKHTDELRKARQQNEDVPGSVNVENIQARQAVEARNLQQKERERERDEILRDRRTADASWISAAREGYDRDLALLKNKHAGEIEDYDKVGRDKTQLLRRQAAEEAALERDKNKQLRDLRYELASETIAASLRGAEAARANLTLSRQKALEDAKGDEERRVVSEIYYQKEKQRLRQQEDDRKSLLSQAVEARLALIKDASQRELAQLLWQQNEERRIAREKGDDMNLILAKQEFERQVLFQKKKDYSPISMFDPGFIRGALPGQSDPMRELINRQDQQLSRTAESNKKLTEVAGLLSEIISALKEDSGETVVNIN